MNTFTEHVEIGDSQSMSPQCVPEKRVHHIENFSVNETRSKADNSVYQVKAHKAYTANDFDEDLRSVLRRAGTKSERMVFIMDESNVMDTAFLERMNTLLANGEVPGL